MENERDSTFADMYLHPQEVDYTVLPGSSCASRGAVAPACPRDSGVPDALATAAASSSSVPALRTGAGPLAHGLG